MALKEEDIFEDLELIEEVSEADLVLDGDEVSVSTATPGPGPGKGIEEGKCPMTTATMAELFVSQGYLKRAFTIYRELLDADPGNPLLKQRLYELKAAIDDDNAAARRGKISGGEGLDGPGALGCEGSSEFVAEEFSCDSGQNPDIVVATLEKWLHVIERRR